MIPPFYNTLSLWIQALWVVVIFSFALWKDNKAFRLAQVILLAGLLGHYTIMAINSITQKVSSSWSTGAYSIIILVVLGFLLYTRFVPKIAWLSRFPVAWMIGIATGLTLRAVVGAQIISQVTQTFLPLTTLDNIVIIVGVVTSIVYFVFTFPRKGPLKYTAIVGRYIMMIAFGAMFGNMILSRMTWLADSIRIVLRALGLLP